MTKKYNELIQNSILEKKFNDILNNDEIKVVSFDIFETLVFRKVTHHHDIFYQMGLEKSVLDIFYTPETFKNYRIKAEKNARLNVYKNEVSFDDIYNELFLTPQDKKLIQKLELDLERKNLYINHQVHSWIKKALKKSKKVILTSDMYLSKKQLISIILKDLDCLDEIENIYVSSEYAERKSTGKLFKIIVNDLNLQEGQLFHIGDKCISDYNMPKKLGFHALHYEVNDNCYTVLDYERKYISHSLGSLYNYRKLSLFLNPYNDSKENFYFNFGAMVFGPVMWQFSHWLHDIVIKEKVEQVNFIMREGKIFEKYFKKINSSVSTNLIYASRKSTYLAKEDENKIDFSKFNFFRFRTFSIEDVYNLYHLDLSNEILKINKDIAVKDTMRIKIDSEYTLYEVFISDFIQKSEEIKTAIREDKKKLLKYLKQLGIKENSIFIDFGGTGTIITNLMRVLSFTPKLNILFFMHDLGYERQANNRTIPFLPYDKQSKNSNELIRRTPEVFEILLNSGEETTIDYNIEVDGSITPVTKDVSFNMAGLRKYIKAFHNGIDAFFETMFEYNQEYRIEHDTLAMILSRCIELPTLNEAQYIGELYTDEGKGSGSINQIISADQLYRIKKIGIDTVYKNALLHNMYDITKTHWLHGCITKIDERYLPNMKGLLKVYPHQNYINEILDILKISGISSVNVYGAGVLFDKLEETLNKYQINIIEVMDSRAMIEPFIYKEYKVKTLEDSINIENQYPIIVASVEYSEEITANILTFLNKNNLDNAIINHTDGLLKTSHKIEEN